MESALYAYMAKERDKALRREFGAQVTDKNLLQEECARLKARVEEVEHNEGDTRVYGQTSSEPGQGEQFQACPGESG